MTKGDLAKSYFIKGYNCAQSVVLAFCDDYNIDKNTALLLSEGLGGGVGRLREVCGAVSGMAIVLSMKYGSSDINQEKKKDLYSHIQSAAADFREANSSIVCKELLQLNSIGGSPQERTDSYYKKRPCAELVKLAAEIVEEELNS